jgi:hypothetical protein
MKRLFEMIILNNLLIRYIFFIQIIRFKLDSFIYESSFSIIFHEYLRTKKNTP